jgi:hypothetical protein
MRYRFHTNGFHAEHRLLHNKGSKTESMSGGDLEKHAKNLEEKLNAQQIEIKNLQDLLKNQQEALDRIGSNPNMPHQTADKRWTIPAVEHLPAAGNSKAAAHASNIIERKWLDPKGRTYLQTYPERYQRLIPARPAPIKSPKKIETPARSFRTRYNRIDGLHYEFWDTQSGVWTKGPQVMSHEQVRAQGERNHQARERHFADQAAKYRAAGYVLKDWNTNRQDVRWQTLDERMKGASLAGMHPLTAAPRSFHQANQAYALDMHAFEKQYDQNRLPMVSGMPERQLTLNQTKTFNQLLRQWQRASLNEIVHWNDAAGNMILWRPVASDAWEGMLIDRSGIARSLGISRTPPSKNIDVQNMPSRRPVNSANRREYAPRSKITELADKFEKEFGTTNRPSVRPNERQVLPSSRLRVEAEFTKGITLKMLEHMDPRLSKWTREFLIPNRTEIERYMPERYASLQNAVRRLYEVHRTNDMLTLFSAFENDFKKMKSANSPKPTLESKVEPTPKPVQKPYEEPISPSAKKTKPAEAASSFETEPEATVLPPKAPAEIDLPEELPAASPFKPSPMEEAKENKPQTSKLPDDLDIPAPAATSVEKENKPQKFATLPDELDIPASATEKPVSAVENLSKE